MQKTCRWCQTNFEVMNEDMAFYEKVSPVFSGKKYLILPPTLCPECRQQRRLVFRNEHKLYNSQCDLCHADIVSVYTPKSSVKAYCSKCWWNDQWNPSDYGKDYDFSQTFFDQFKTLMRNVPRPALLSAKSENSDYTHIADNNKNCYLTFLSGECENVYYGYWLNNCVSCLDVSDSGRLELCYEVIFSDNCYHLFYANNCGQCRDSYFLDDCTGCHDCILCTGLQHKEYYFLNQPLTKAEYEKKKAVFLQSLPSNIAIYKQKLQELKIKTPQRYANIIASENCTGDNVVNSKNCQHCYCVYGSEDCKFCYDMIKTKQSYDAAVFGKPGELLYEVNDVGLNAVRVLFTSYAYYLSESLYCDSCFNSSNLFGCVGLKKNQYCILNKQYSKEEYEALVPRIIESMRRLPALQDKQMMATPPTSSSEEGSLEWPASRSFSEGWGEFFPPSLSPFGYNETVAMEYFPLTKEEALAKGFNWSDYEPPKPDVQKVIPASKLPDNIKDIPDDILNWAIECEVTQKPFRIIKQELSFYREHNLPVPRRHPDQRHKDRMALRNPRKLYQRQCDCTKEEHNHSTVIPSPPWRIEESAQHCPTTFQTTYSPERKEKVYCEACYLQTVY